MAPSTSRKACGEIVLTGILQTTHPSFENARVSKTNLLSQGRRPGNEIRYADEIHPGMDEVCPRADEVRLWRVKNKRSLRGERCSRGDLLFCEKLGVLIENTVKFSRSCFCNSFAKVKLHKLSYSFFAVKFVLSRE